MNLPVAFAIFLSATACSSSAASISAAKSAATVADITAFAGKIRTPLKKARYMESQDLGVVEVPGWKGFPTRKFRYALKDRDGTVRSVEAIMLNPPAEMLATWILSASHSIKGKTDPVFCKRLFDHVITCSGGQFVVRGICLEDMDGDGIHKAYPFQDGVTVRLQKIDRFPERPLTEIELKAALESTIADVEQVYKYARIQSSTASQWAASVGGAELSGGDWLAAVRSEYQKAWRSPANAMLAATARALQF